MTVRVTTLPPHHVAYMRYVGPYGADGIPALWRRFSLWIETHGFDADDRVTIGIGHDDARVTPPKKCRYDACLVVPPTFAGDAWVNVMDLPGGRYAVQEFVGTAHEIVPAWDALYARWLPTSGYQPDDRPCLEIYRGRPDVSGQPGAFRCELCVPVRPL